MRSWAKYIRKHGSLDIGRRLDRTMGIIASHFGGAMFKYRGNKKPSPDNFTLYPEQKTEVVASIDDQLLNFFGKGKKLGK